ncbi:1-phosphatidylinositol 4,5-bisphosphate phosphodiesterase epsilon-1 [Caerostris extrusa]|uniref:1-phosphatidylinositol 4,5-bisphosphate phosphodiesterase epsilon-1 n=1 Tax=Caerostris extrusa TaxID=172846 RepID=A0AAV4N6G4_CAEEX|nr:1-phosphatidylinositol 4,5-bisphosphate phosphodiesterase epsilon-1 [Caerostris extrusa]
MRLWQKGIEFVIGELKKQKKLSDRRISWLKEKYLYLFFEDLVCCGPTPADAIQVFGGRKWTLGSVGSSSSMDTSGFKRVASFGVSTGKLRKKKSQTSLAAIRDCSPKSQSSLTSEILGEYSRRSPSLKTKRSHLKSGEISDEAEFPSTPGFSSNNRDRSRIFSSSSPNQGEDSPPDLRSGHHALQPAGLHAVHGALPLLPGAVPQGPAHLVRAGGRVLQRTLGQPQRGVAGSGQDGGLFQEGAR